jgi:hypothetical protein
VRYQRQCCGINRAHQRHAKRLRSTEKVLFSRRWYSWGGRAADLPLLACCPPELVMMPRSPMGTPAASFACACDAHRRSQRPFCAEMAENETI